MSSRVGGLLLALEPELLCEPDFEPRELFAVERLLVPRLAAERLLADA